MAVLPLRIRKHTTEFGVQWKVTNQGVVISIHRTGVEAIGWLHRELVAVQQLQAQQAKNQRMAKILMARLQQNTDRELAAQKKQKELGQ